MKFLLLLLSLALVAAKEDCGCGFIAEAECSIEVAACVAVCTASFGAGCLACVAKMSDQCCLCLADIIGKGGCILCDCGCKEYKLRGKVD